MIKRLAFILSIFMVVYQANARSISLKSPDKKITVKVNVGSQISYEVFYNGKKIIKNSKISLTVNDKVLGKNPRLKNRSTKHISETLYPVVKQKSSEIKNDYELLTLNFSDYDVQFAAYNDAIAWRFITHKRGGIIVNNELAEFNFANEGKVWFPEEKTTMTHQERSYEEIDSYDILKGQFSIIPALFDFDGLKVAITETGLKDYSGMYLEAKGKGTFKGMFPNYPLETKPVNLSLGGGDRNIPVTKKADYIAKTKGEKEFPWRIIAFAENDGDLITNQIVYKLAPKQVDMDFSWVKPGKVAWDWWNALNIYGVDFKSGVNTDTYKYYIDFASKYGIEYIILDEGWYVLGDLLNIAPDVDIQELVNYGKEKNVGIILWVVWKTLEDQWTDAFNQFEKWGVKGIKVDFMQRDDQLMVDYYWRVAEEAAKRKMLVDFHGSYKPAGLRRAYPNVITREGVKGLENDKWSTAVTPKHDVTIPFIRMFAGPMDFTPGAMVNANKENFKPIFNRPMSQGTRCHQLAMYVVYESPLQMLADCPTHYYEQPDAMDFLSKVPTVWDETKVLDAKVGEYVIIARRNGKTWYIGGMTNWTKRDFTIDLSFLKDGEHTITMWQDGINADRYAEDYVKSEKSVSSTEKMNIHLAPGGGFAAIIE